MLFLYVYFNIGKEKRWKIYQKSYMTIQLYTIKLYVSYGTMIIFRINTYLYRCLHYNDWVRFSKGNEMSTDF